MPFPYSDQQISDFVEGDRQLTDDQFDELFPYYLDNGLIPYGTATARTGDPHNFIAVDLIKRARGILTP